MTVATLIKTRGVNMKTTGIVRKLDELGRIVIPSELRKTLNLNEKDPMEIFLENEMIIIQKYESKKQCMVTGLVDSENFSLYNGKLILSKTGLGKLIDELEMIKNEY